MIPMSSRETVAELAVEAVNVLLAGVFEMRIGSTSSSSDVKSESCSDADTGNKILLSQTLIRSKKRL